MSTVRIPRQRRGALLPTLVIAAVVVVIFAIFTNVWTERLWFTSIAYDSVFDKLLLTRSGLFIAFGLMMATAVSANVAIAYRIKPRFRTGEPSSALLERYREVLESRFALVMGGVGVVVGLFAGGAAIAQANTYLAWQNSTPFGQVDEKFGIDISFFVFDYPWWRFVLSFAFTALIFAAIAAALVHFVMGGLRLSKPGRGGSPAAQAHLSILVGLAIVVQAVNYWFDQYGLEVEQSTLFTGLGYTADTATSRAVLILAVIAVICALMFFANAVLRRWMVPTIGLTLLLLSAIVLGMAYPGLVQAISVSPDEPDKERPYIEKNIAATRDAYGVSDVSVTDYSAETEATAGQLRADAEALPGIRLIDPAVVGPAYEQLQQVRGYYSFPKILDVDRYTIDGEQTDAVVAAREMDLSGVEQQNWNNLTTVYTHGFGMVAAYGNQRQAGGEPAWISKDIPPTGKISEHEARIYFGELQAQYSIVGREEGAAPIELDTPGGGEGGNPKMNAYTGKGGVPIGSAWNRLLYATKFADVNMLLSDRVTDASKIIYDREPRERVMKAAPWLEVDSDAYPAVVDGRIVWIVDGYTTSDSYPYAERVSLQDATSDSQTEIGTVAAQPDTMINYMRNSVKATVDAYDGTVTLYEWDEEDPVLQTWEKAFPGVVTPKSEISDDLKAHLRYPEDLFKVQRAILARYHITDPGGWYQASDLWEIPTDPGAPANSTTKETTYFLSIKWPGDDEAIFSQTATYVPNQRENLAAYMAVNADASSPDYGQLRILRMSDNTQIDGPGQTANALSTNETVAERLRPFTQGAASIQNGNLLTLPMGGGLMYVQPVYTQRQGSDGSYPVLRFVLVRFGQEVGIGETLQEALDAVFKGDSGAETEEEGTTPPEEGEEPPPSSGDPDQVAASKAIAEAEAAFTAADKALSDGDLGLYQDKINEAKAALERAKTAMGG